MLYKIYNILSVYMIYLYCKYCVKYYKCWAGIEIYIIYCDIYYILQ